MNFKELLDIQKDFDKSHGWASNTDSIDDFLSNLNDDLIGLMGEVGEFANIVKKIKLNYKSLGLDTRSQHNNGLKEEFTDSLIYLIRIATHLNIDIEQEYLKKLNINRERFSDYEQQDKL
ncbi:hypothetical protein [Nitratidesulfovibrio vulgaris]|uniref:hypothetical protein n=1 Tax=Nitratidesulfovibrio vulgaris TaxID=881 RepID=UPI002300E222|nr:hypothetical protein [Nitratidesulfovibrio vulgaris]WCB46971.1 hypothetical protein PH214_02515 [Nitratidesulfovibrio vulgaris]